MTTPKLDILKRYKPKKAKKGRTSKEHKGLKVVVESDYIPPNHSNVTESLEYDEFDEDAPVIAEIIDDRPDGLKATDRLFGKGMWRAISSDAAVDRPNKDFQGIKLEIGQRLNLRSLKAAQKMSDIARQVLSSQSEQQRGNPEPVPCTNWRNLEVLPTEENAVSETPAKAESSDSDLSPERPAQTERADLSKRTSSTMRRAKAVEDDIEAKQRREERYKMWARGIAQVKQSETTIGLLFEAKDQPLARYRDDKELDDHLKKQVREGDPMAKFLTAKCTDKDEPEQQRPRCKHTAPPNRFGIEPGFRWDGVDRSNGFERKVFNMDAGKKSIAEHAYKWRVEDM